MKYLVITVLIAAVHGCGSDREPSDASVAEIEYGEAARALFDERLNADEAIIIFRSWNGKWIGTDVDTDLALATGGRVLVIEYGDAVNGYAGRYEVDDAGIVKLSLNDHHGWPEMALGVHEGELILNVEGGSFEFGTRGGAVVRPGDGSYWPFREIETEDHQRDRYQSQLEALERRRKGE